jgi:hypothetical protein
MFVLKDIPPKTPLWALGIATIIVATTFGTVTVYTSIRGEVQDVIKEKAEEAKARADQLSTNLDLQKKMTAGILDMVNTQGKQIIVLTNALEIAEHDIANLKHELETTQGSLGSCELKLKACKKF